MTVVSELGTERVLQLSGGPIRTYERGHGPPIVFVHGLFANAAAWRHVVPLLADDFRCISTDWPFGSHHRAMNPDADLTPAGIASTIAETLTVLGLRDVTLVGNDGGGMLAQLVVTTQPDRVGRLVLTSCDAYDNFPPPMFAYLCRLARIPGGSAVLDHAMRLRPLRRLPPAYGWLSHSRVPHRVLDHYISPLRDRGIRRDARKFLGSVSTHYTTEAARRFGEFDRPVLVAWAADDRFFPLAHARRLATDFPHARLSVIADSRIYIAEDQPTRLAELIREFIPDPAPAPPDDRREGLERAPRRPES